MTEREQQCCGLGGDCPTCPDASSNRVAKDRCPDCDGLGYWYGPDGERIICPHAIPNRVGNEPKECPKCSSQAPWFHTHCGLCGTPLDATRNRVPRPGAMEWREGYLAGWNAAMTQGPMPGKADCPYD